MASINPNHARFVTSNKFPESGVLKTPEIGCDILIERLDYDSLDGVKIVGRAFPRDTMGDDMRPPKPRPRTEAERFIDRIAAEDTPWTQTPPGYPDMIACKDGEIPPWHEVPTGYAREVRRKDGVLYVGGIVPMPQEPSKLDELLRMPKVEVIPNAGTYGDETFVIVGKLGGSIDPKCRFYRWRLRRLKERLIREHYANLEAELSCKTEEEL